MHSIPPPASALSNKKKWLFRGLAVFLALLLTFCVCELLLRTFYHLKVRGSMEELRANVPQDPEARVTLGDLIFPTGEHDVIYRLKPGARGMHRGVPLSINASGYRDAPLLEKAANEKRVVVLGDSNSFGWAVEMEENWTERLEEALNRIAPDGERALVINTAVPGYNARMETALYFQDQDQLQADLVLLQYCNNDTVLPSFIVHDEFFRDWTRSFLLERVGGGLPAFSLDFMDVPFQMSPGHFEKMDVKRVPTRYQHHVGVEALCDAYAGLQKSCQEKGIPLRVVLLAEEVYPFHPEVKENQVVAEILPYLQKLNLPLVDCFPETQAFAIRYGVTTQEMAVDAPRDWHPNPLRHILMARVLLPHCARLLWPESAPTAIEAERERLLRMALEQRKTP